MSADRPFAPLISTDRVADLLGDPRLVVVDATVLGVESELGFHWVSGLDDYLIEGHLPGAVFGDLVEEFSDHGSRLSFTRPDVARLTEAARGLGIDDGSTVVVYDSSIGQWAARFWWLLRAAGFDRVAVLDGGLARWRAEGRTIETGYVAPRTAGDLTLVDRPERWADREEVGRISSGELEGALVCAAPAGDFRGESGRRARRGHIPGSVNVPLSALVDRESRAYLSGEALTERLAPATEADAGRVVVYCGAGIAASGTALLLTVAGHQDVAVYDGSLDEWVADPDAPLVSLV